LLCDSLRQRGHAFRRQPQQALRRRRVMAAAVTGQWVKGERRMTEKVMAHSGKPGGSEDAAAASLAATPMAAARLGAERSERQGVRGAMERRERRRGPLGRSVLEAQGARRRDREAGHASAAGARCSRMAATHRARVAPLRHSTEQLAGIGVGMVERRFGPATGRFGSWAQNEVCSPRHALHFLLRHSNHSSNGLTVN